MAVLVIVLTNGTTADANEVMSDLYPLYSDIDNSNIAAAAGILWTKMENLTQNWILVGNASNKATPSATLPAAVVGAIDHNTLLNLTVGDPHTQYIKVDGTRAFTGDQSMGANALTTVKDPVNPQDAATKNYVDTQDGAFIKKDGTVAFTGDQSMGNHLLTNVTDPVNPQDVCTKNYADTILAGSYVTLGTVQTITANKVFQGSIEAQGGVFYDGVGGIDIHSNPGIQLRSSVYYLGSTSTNSIQRGTVQHLSGSLAADGSTTTILGTSIAGDGATFAGEIILATKRSTDPGATANYACYGRYGFVAANNNGGGAQVLNLTTIYEQNPGAATSGFSALVVDASGDNVRIRITTQAIGGSPNMDYKMRVEAYQGDVF